MLGNDCSKELDNGAMTPALSHNNLRMRAGAALAAGCLALSLCPALAFAAPTGQQDAAQGNPPAMQQDGGKDMQAPDGFDFGDKTSTDQQAPDGQAPSQGQAPDGQAPDGQAPSQGQAPDGQTPPQGQAPDGQAPDGQAPDGQQLPQGQAPDGQRPSVNAPGNDDALGNQVRQSLADEYGIETALPNADAGNQAGQGAPQGKPSEAPELPEGAVNVQQIIDSLRDVISKFGSSVLSEKLSDDSFATEVKDYAVSANDQRLADFAKQTAQPGADAQGEGQAPAGEQPSSGEQPPALDEQNTTVDSTVMNQIIAWLMEAFGFTASA